jgi:lipopolysaccharide transport system ATP-binding protein
VLAVGDAEFQRKCLGKMSDVAHQGRTVLFVSHNMSAILNLTEEALVLEHGRVALRAPAAQAVDYYLSSGFSQEGKRIWTNEEVPASAAPFRPLALRVLNSRGEVSDTIRSVEGMSFEAEYELAEAITGLRVGIYLMSTRGEMVFVSFDTDNPEHLEKYSTRPAGKYVSRCNLPPDLLNGGRYILGINASAFRIGRYFQDEQALAFNVDVTGAPGTHWAEQRQGAVRPRLNWEIEVN